MGASITPYLCLDSLCQGQATEGLGASQGCPVPSSHCKGTSSLCLVTFALTGTAPQQGWRSEPDQAGETSALGRGKSYGYGGSEGKIIAWSHLSKPIKAIIPITLEKKYSQDKTAAPDPTVCLPMTIPPQPHLDSPGKRPVKLLLHSGGSSIILVISLPLLPRQEAAAWQVSAVLCLLSQTQVPDIHTHADTHAVSQGATPPQLPLGARQRAGGPDGLIYTSFYIPSVN